MTGENMTKETVVVTGASAGLGRAIAMQFAKRGAQVALLARGQEGLAAAEREVNDAGGRGLAIPTEVADPAAVEAAAETAEQRFGPIDIWVNNAMVSVFSPAKEMKPEEYKRTTEVTYLGTVYGTLAAMKRMLPRDRGAIVQVGSALAYRSIPLQSAYCAAKHAIVGFTDSIRCELLHDNSKVHITVVHMPALNTAQFGWVRNKLPRKAQPVPPIFEPEVGARAVYWAAHHHRREVYVGGSTVKAIVGNKIAPGLLDHYLARNGFNAQQTSEPEDASRPDNLWSPLDAQQDRGAHGAFDSRSLRHSAQSWANLHRGALSALIGSAAGVAGALYYVSKNGLS
jgi:NAD(P)-dependent dehydrogenase (short-subunit alcohol dehydrogenase family)